MEETNGPKLTKSKKNIQIQNTQKKTTRMNSKKPTLRQITKGSKVKDRESPQNSKRKSKSSGTRGHPQDDQQLLIKNITGLGLL